MRRKRWKRTASLWKNAKGVRLTRMGYAVWVVRRFGGDKGVHVKTPKEEPERTVEVDEPETSAKERCDVLLDAMKAVCSDRNLRYGEPEDNFGVIAELWSAYLDAGIPGGACKVDLGARQVADMMILFKVGRMATSMGDHRDTYVDIAGYAACAGGMCGE